MLTNTGLAKAAEILAGQFTLVATNVPYLGSGKQDDELKDYCEQVHPDAKSDLATCFVERCLTFCACGGSTTLVTPHNWLFLSTYKKLRARLLIEEQLDSVSRLGEHAFESSQAAGAFVALVSLTRNKPGTNHEFAGIEASEPPTPDAKASVLRDGQVIAVKQASQRENPDDRIGLENTERTTRLEASTISLLGLGTCDAPHYVRCFWEQSSLAKNWAYMQTASENADGLAGRESVVAWDVNSKRVFGMTDEERRQGHNQDYRGSAAWGKRGVAISLIRNLKVSPYTGELFDKSVAVIIPKRPTDLPAIAAFCTSEQFTPLVRKLDQKVMVTNSTLIKVPFDLAHWQKVAAEKYPHGLPKPFSSDPTQWLFNGHPAGADQPLHVAVARLLGYQWPRQTGSSFPDCPALKPDGLEKFADDDGIVCLSATKGEAPAAERLRGLLVQVLGNFELSELLAGASPKGSKSETLEDWLRDEFFEQHCALFHHRPFIWHIWDGHKSGFSALVNYHKLTHANLEKLTYSYLGDWIRRQQAAVDAGDAGSDARLQAAKQLQSTLKLILDGEPPYDIFVRWKPLSQQAIGWHPDINDGVRMNIRPFAKADILRKRVKIKWEKDRGKEPLRDKKEFPWFYNGSVFTGDRMNDVHLTKLQKEKSPR